MLVLTRLFCARFCRNANKLFSVQGRFPFWNYGGPIGGEVKCAPVKDAIGVRSANTRAIKRGDLIAARRSAFRSSVPHSGESLRLLFQRLLVVDSPCCIMVGSNSSSRMRPTSRPSESVHLQLAKKSNIAVYYRYEKNSRKHEDRHQKSRRQPSPDEGSDVGGESGDWGRTRHI